MSRLTDDFQAIPGLLSDTAEQLGKLVQNEAQLARAELSQKMAQAATGAAYMVGAALLSIPVLVLLLIALALFLGQQGLSPALSHLIAAGVGIVIAGVLAMVGAKYLKPEELKPSVTLRQVQRDIQTAKELAR
jgi:Putative Actinobacterial Holin-X, holin superfamily III